MQTPPPFRVDAQPTLGVALMAVQQPDPGRPVHTPSIPPPSNSEMVLRLAILDAKVDALREDVRLLRADLAARTWSARWHRFTVWLRAFFKE